MRYVSNLEKNHPITILPFLATHPRMMDGSEHTKPLPMLEVVMQQF